MDYHGLRWIDENTATRHTKEVQIKCTLSENGKKILLEGTGDFEHHLLEDSAIFLKKICNSKLGEHFKGD